MLSNISRILPVMVGGGGGSSKIYGVSWSGAASPTLTRTDDAVGLIANAGVGSCVVVNDFDSLYPWSDMTEVTDALGNKFIRIPRFFIKKTAVGAARTWQISRGKFDGSYLPACFANADYVDVGKYKANLNGTKLESKSGTFPLINKNIVDFRTYAMNNGTGYYQMDIHVVDLLRTLFYIEFATLNSQAIMAGFTNGQWNAVHTATVNENAVNRVIVANAVAALYFAGQTVGLGTSLGGEQVFTDRVIQSIDVYDASMDWITRSVNTCSSPTAARPRRSSTSSSSSSGSASSSSLSPETGGRGSPSTAISSSTPRSSGKPVQRTWCPRPALRPHWLWAMHWLSP